MKASQLNFLEYLSKEEHNFLTSLVNFRGEFELFRRLDQI